LAARDDSLIVLLSAAAEVVDDFAEDMTVLRQEVLQLRAAMETRAPIAQARGMVMMRYGLSAESSFRLLLRWSRTQKVELRVLAVPLVSLGIEEGSMTNHCGRLAAAPVSRGIQDPPSRRSRHQRDVQRRSAGHGCGLGCFDMLRAYCRRNNLRLTDVANRVKSDPMRPRDLMTP
jgi:hypothetical protein